MDRKSSCFRKPQKDDSFPKKSNLTDMEKSIRRFCQIDPLMFFAFPPKEEPTVVQPTLDLHVYPPFAEFIEFGGASKHVLTNAGSSRMVFKVKCSNNSLFKVSPVYAFLDSGASMELQILRQEGPTRNDKLIIMYKEAKRAEKDPKKSFENEGVTAKKVLPLITRDVEET
uniref:Major sperm protein n=1 Tax=Haemonchus contortus TaxID=6289 RepID=A0A7I4Y9V4_HAECO